MNLVRHELGYSEQARRFPLKATCLAIYSRAVNATEPLEAALKHFPWCAEWKDELTGLFAAYVEAKQAPARARLRRPPPLLGRADAGAGAGRRGRRPVRSRAGRRVPGHQRAAGRDPGRPQAGRQGPLRGRRRRTGDLWLPRRHRAQHPRLPRPVRPAGNDRARSSRTTARPSRSSPPPTPSSASRASSSPRTCAHRVGLASGRRWSRSPTTSARSG